MATYDGTTWRTTTVLDSAIPGAPKLNQTRQVISNGRNVTQTFDGTNWIDTGLGDLATPGAPKVNDTRQSVQNGRYVFETFDGTTWRPTGVGANATPDPPSTALDSDTEVAALVAILPPARCTSASVSASVAHGGTRDLNLVWHGSRRLADVIDSSI